MNAASRTMLIAGVAFSTGAFAQPSKIERIVVTPAEATVVVGGTVQVKGVAVDAAGKPVEGATVRFGRGNGPSGPFRGQVKPDGTVLAGAPGAIHATASAIIPGEKPVVQRFTVRAVPGAAAEIVVDPAPSKMAVGQELTLRSTVYAVDKNPRLEDVVVWTSSAPGVVKIGRAGALIAVAPGAATITGKAGAAARTFRVQVTPSPASLEFSKVAEKIRTGDVLNLGVVARDNAGREITDLTPTFSTAGGGSLIDGAGQFVAYDPGLHTVTATVGGRSVVASIEVVAREARRPIEVVGKFIPGTEASAEVWVHPTAKVAYLSTFDGSFYTLDVSDPTNPVVGEKVLVNSRLINDIMVSEDGKVLVATREGAPTRKNGIAVFTLDDPLHPKLATEFAEPVASGVHSAFINTTAKYGRMVYMTDDGQGRLVIANIDDPANPKVVGTWQTERPDVGIGQGGGRYLHDIEVRDGILYASYLHDGLVILDVGNGMKGGTPMAPKLISQLKYDFAGILREASMGGVPAFGGTHTAFRYKDYLFITDEILGVGQPASPGPTTMGAGGLKVVDVSDIEHPKIVAWQNPAIGGSHNVWVDNDILYIGGFAGGFRAYDVSGQLKGDLQAQGREIGWFQPVDSKGFVPNSPYTWGTVVKDGIAYVNDMSNGLFLARIQPKIEVE